MSGTARHRAPGSRRREHVAAAPPHDDAHDAADRGHPVASAGAPELVILMGLPGAGKSTFYVHRLAPTHAHVSMDAMPRSSDRRRRQRRLVEEALAAGRSVAVDNVNPTRAERAALIATAHEAGARVRGYWLAAPPRACLGRNQRRTGAARVPPVAIFAFATRFEEPERAEGFAELWRVRATGTAAEPDFAVEAMP